MLNLLRICYLHLFVQYAGPVSSVSKRNLPRACEVAAAQVGDAKGIRKKITEMKMHLIKDALKRLRRPGGAKRFAARPGG